MLAKTDIPKLLLAGMRTNFMKAYDIAVKDHEKLATTIKSTKSSETYPWLNSPLDQVKSSYIAGTP